MRSYDIWSKGQIIATSHDLGPQKVAKELREILLFQGLGWRNIIILPDDMKNEFKPCCFQGVKGCQKSPCFERGGVENV